MRSGAGASKCIVATLVAHVSTSTAISGIKVTPIPELTICTSGSKELPSIRSCETGSNSYEATNRTTGKVVRTASRTDLVFGSNSELRAIAEVYAQEDNQHLFANTFVSAWNKVMDADRL